MTTMSPDAARTARILSIDGGGIRGVIPGSILVELERQLGVPLASAFHMIAGTSTGGILASALAHGLPASTALDLYVKDGGAIFSGALFGSLDGAKYPAAPLEAVLKSSFGDTKLSDLKHDLLIPSYDLNARADLLFKSWRARGVESTDPRGDDFLLRDVARSTSAAPTYFAPALVSSQSSKQYPLIDGGMFANNPALMAMVAARRLMPLATRYLVVSLGTGELANPIAYADAQNWGLIGWASPMVDIIFSAMNATVDYELDQLAPLVAHTRIQSSLAGANDALDDASPANITALVACANRTLADRKADVDALVAELRTPLPDRTMLGYPQPGAPPRPKIILSFNLPAIKAAAAAQALKGAHGVKAVEIATSTSTSGLAWRIGGAAAGAVAGGSVGAFGGPLGAAAGLAVGALSGFFAGRKAAGT